jgi:hypothetical protein
VPTKPSATVCDIYASSRCCAHAAIDIVGQYRADDHKDQHEGRGDETDRLGLVPGEPYRLHIAGAEHEIEEERAAEHGVHQRRAQDGQRHVVPDLTRRILESCNLRLVLLEDEAVHGARADDQADATRKPMMKKMRQTQATKSSGVISDLTRIPEPNPKMRPERYSEPDPRAPEGAVLGACRLLGHPRRGGTQFGAEADAVSTLLIGLTPTYD